jgi:single-strand DNA-binding protein
MIVVSGRLQIRSWTDNDGNKRRSAEIVADNVYFGESKKSAESTDQPFTTGSFGSPGYAAPPTPAYAVIEDDDGQLPF